MKETDDEKKSRRAAYMREYHAKNRDKINSEKRDERQRNNEAYNERHRNWVKNNSEHMRQYRRSRRDIDLEKKRQWARDNPDKIKAYRKLDRERHGDEQREKSKEYYRANAEAAKAKAKKYRQENLERLRASEKEKRAANRELFAENRKRYIENNRASVALHGTRKSAKQQRVECDLDREWFKTRLDAGVCEMSGLPFDMKTKRGPNSPSVDRKIAGGPYTKENCRMILWSINRALSNHGEEYLIGVFRRIISTQTVGVADNG